MRTPCALGLPARAPPAASRLAWRSLRLPSHRPRFRAACASVAAAATRLCQLNGSFTGARCAACPAARFWALPTAAVRLP